MSSTRSRSTERRSRRPFQSAMAVALVVVVMGGSLVANANAGSTSIDAWKRLAERALAQGAPVKLRLRPGFVDPALRSALPPIPKGWATLGTIDRVFEPPFAGGNATPSTISETYFDVPNASSATLDQWHQRFLSDGWTQPTPSPSIGQVPFNAPQSRTYCRGNRAVSVRSTPVPAATTVIVVDLTRPCGTASGLPQLTELQNAMRVPKLTLSPGIVIVNQKAGTGSLTSDTADFTVETPRAVAELHALAADQMTASGWALEETATSPTLVVSRWRRTVDGATITAFVYVSTTPGPNRRTISITTWNKAFAVDLNFTGTVAIPPSGPVTTKLP